MIESVHVHLLPDLIPAGALKGGVAVVIDILRASTVIVHALGNGARGVIPVPSVETALETARQREQQGEARVLLGGERHCQLIPGFDLGNSPLDYTENRVADAMLVFTTTNGTRALSLCDSADQVIIGAFVNQQAVVDFLRSQSRPVHLVCAGTDGEITGEDVLFAGRVASALLKDAAEHSIGKEVDISTELAMNWANQHRSAGESTLDLLLRSRGARSLRQLGYLADIERCATADLFDIVPLYTPSSTGPGLLQSVRVTDRN